MRHSKRIAQRVIDGQAFVVDPKERVLHAFNAAGSRVWELAGLGKDLEQVAAALAREFEVAPERARRDAEAFLGRLEGMGLLEA